MLHKLGNCNFKHKNIQYAIYAYLVFITILCYFMMPSHDIIYYYYPWSFHLQLSYYDGPPFIAYCLKLITCIFGNNQFALNFFAVIVSSATCYVIIKIGELLCGSKLGLIAAYLWLVYPFVATRFIFATANYDCLDNLFSLLTIFLVLKYFTTTQAKYLYAAGIAAGCLLLSKYTGVITLLGILIYCVINKDWRKIFYTRHCYLALLICLVLFSPVLIWNYQHHWVSFQYQLSVHTWQHGHFAQNRHGISGILFYLNSDILGVLHVLLLLLLIVAYKYYKMKDCYSSSPSPTLSTVQLNLLWAIVIVYFLFWLCISPFAHVAMNYLLVPDSIVIILSSYYLLKYDLHKVLVILMILFTMISICMMLYRTFGVAPPFGDVFNLAIATAPSW